MANEQPSDRVVAHHEAAHAVIRYRTCGFVGGPTKLEQKDEHLGITVDTWGNRSDPDYVAGRLLSIYAAGCAQRAIDASTGNTGCGSDDENASELLWEWGWETREAEFRARSAELVAQYWPQIVAVAEELLRLRTLDDTEVELIADRVAGDPDADVDAYRRKRAQVTRVSDRADP
jgi:hypothetical protein